MTCNEARRLITAYVKKELPDRELEQFLYHVEHCSDCMDELVRIIRYIRRWICWIPAAVTIMISEIC